MKTLIRNLFKKRERRYYIPAHMATSQSHQMLITLINAYPNAVATWVFSTPEHGIMNQWDVCRLLRKKGVDIVLKSEPHINRFGRDTQISYYAIAETSITFARELEVKMRDNLNLIDKS
jgi:hypothetical protein